MFLDCRFTKAAGDEFDSVKGEEDILGELADSRRRGALLSPEDKSKCCKCERLLSSELGAPLLLL